MDDKTKKSKEHFIQGISRITHFWGFPKAMGAIFGVVYLSIEPITLDELVKQIGISKGAVSTNIRNLERLGIVHKKLILGDRKDYYIAETDFWKIVKGILREREKNEFNHAIMAVGESIEILEKDSEKTEDLVKLNFYKERMLSLKQFFDSLDNLVAALLAIDDLKNNMLKKFLNKKLK
jgi:DNA-binding transcriptional regulator GbsR (MarR family)